MQISDAEWIVMNLIWQSGPIDAAKVVERLADANCWSSATVKTMLHRLVKKGCCRIRPTARNISTGPACAGTTVSAKPAARFWSVFLAVKQRPALLHLVKTSKLSADEVAELRALLDAKELNSK